MVVFGYLGRIVDVLGLTIARALDAKVALVSMFHLNFLSELVEPVHL